MFTDKIISKLQDQSHNKQQYLTNLLRKIQRITKHDVWDSLPKSYNYEPQSRLARLWLDMIIAQNDAHNFDAARSMLNSNADTETATQLTTPDA